LTNGCPESHPLKAAKPSFRHACGRADRILRPRGQGGVKFIVISENYILCHANLNTTIKDLCFIIFHSSLINTIMLLNDYDYMPLKV
jgi:hypothetical protein